MTPGTGAPVAGAVGVAVGCTGAGCCAFGTGGGTNCGTGPTCGGGVSWRESPRVNPDGPTDAPTPTGGAPS